MSLFRAQSSAALTVTLKSPADGTWARWDKMLRKKTESQGLSAYLLHDVAEEKRAQDGAITNKTTKKQRRSSDGKLVFSSPDPEKAAAGV